MLNFLIFLYLLAFKISYSAELSMKNHLYPRALIRRRDLQRQVWDSTDCLCSISRTLGI